MRGWASAVRVARRVARTARRHLAHVLRRHAAHVLRRVAAASAHLLLHHLLGHLRIHPHLGHLKQRGEVVAVSVGRDGNGVRWR